MPKFAALFLLFFFSTFDGVHADYGGYDAARTVGARRTGGERDPLVLPSNLPHKPNEYEGASHLFWYENKPFAHAHGGHEETYGGKLHQHHAAYGSDQLDGNNFITDPPGVGLNAQENRDNYEKPKPSVDFDVVENSATTNPHAHRVHPTTAASTRGIDVDVGAAHSSTPTPSASSSSSSSSSSPSSPLQVPYKSAHGAEEKVDEDGAPKGPNEKEDTKAHVSAHEYESSVTSTSTKRPCCACCAEQSESAGGGHSPSTSKIGGHSPSGPSTSAPSTSAYVRPPTSSYVNPLTPFAPLTSLTSTGSQNGGLNGGNNGGGGSYATSPNGSGGPYATSRTGGGGFYATSGGGSGGGCAGLGSSGFNAGCGSSACGCQQAPAPCCPQLPTCCVQLQLPQLPCCPRIEFCCPQQPLCCQPTGCGVCRSRAVRARRVKRTGCVSCAGRKKRDVLDEIHGCVPCLRRRKREQQQCASCSPFTRQLVSRVKRSFLSTCSPCANRRARAKREAEIAAFHDLEYDSPLQCDRSCCDYSKCLKSKPLNGRK
ncbi:hypothetical protein M3Y99_00822400 [Aphelenchoides fujianensis]|nr:hypothetical protein M3Y99_00822400 [Aphelenchoides fujianensis]